MAKKKPTKYLQIPSWQPAPIFEESVSLKTKQKKREEECKGSL